MESFVNMKALIHTKLSTVCVIVWTIVVLTSATEYKYEKLRDEENFDTFNSSHTIILGHRMDGDRFIFSQLTDCDRRWFRVTTTDFVYPGGPLENLNATISCIRVTDIGYPSKGGGFLIKSGGIGHTSVIIQYTSLWNQPMKYFVEAFGMYPKMNTTRRVTLAWYMPTNNKKVVKLMRRYFIATSRCDGSPIFSPLKQDYMKALLNVPATLPDGRPYYVKKRGKRKIYRMFIPRVVNYETFYRTTYKVAATLFKRRFTAIQSPYERMNRWEEGTRQKLNMFLPKPIIIQLPTKQTTTTDCMQVFDVKKH